MANLIAAATGNFTAAGSWGTVETSGEIDSQAGTVVISTSNIDSPVFTPGAITVDGVALKLAGRAASPAGTLTVTLRNSSGSVDVTSVTVNVSDLHAAGLGWVFFKFSASQLLLAATNYIIRCVCSNTGSQVTLYRSTTGTNNMSKKIRTTTTQAPATDNHIVVCGELTGAGTGNDFTVTMENTATTSFGPTVSGGPPQGIVVSSRGILTWATSPSTAFYLKWKGVFMVAGGGIVNVGTVGTPMPSTSTATLDCDVVANVDTGIEVLAGGTFKAYGTPPTTKWTKLSADAAAAATVLTLLETSGWAANNSIALAATSSATNPTAHEKKTISTVDSGTQVTLTAGLSFAHLGTDSERLCEVGNLTRNVKLLGVSTTLSGYFIANGATAVAVLHSCEVVAFGSSTGSKRGIECTVTGVALTVSSSVIRDCSTNAIACNNTSGVPALVFTDNVLYLVGTFFNLTVSGGFGTVSGNLCIGFSASSVIVTTGGDTFKDNALNSQQANFTTILSVGPTSDGTDCSFTRANWSGNTLHHAASASLVTLRPARSYAGTLLSWKLWSASSGSAGLFLNAARMGCFNNFILESWNVFGTGSSGIRFSETCHGLLRLISCTFSQSSVGINGGGAAVGFLFGSVLASASVTSLTVIAEDCTFGVVTGVHTAHATADIDITLSMLDLQMVLVNSSLASATPIQGLTNCSDRSYIVSQKWAQTAGDHRGKFPYGISTRDTNIFNTASPSLRLVPSSAAVKFGPSVRHVQCDSGVAPTVSVYVRKSASTDASYQGITPADYNGAQPRLIVKRAPALGLAVDTVIDTMTVGLGSWEQLTGALPVPTDTGVFEVYVDCDGTAGWINIDDWTVA